MTARWGNRVNFYFNKPLYSPLCAEKAGGAPVFVSDAKQAIHLTKRIRVAKSPSSAMKLSDMAALFSELASHV
jgi:hypothetical protein